MKKIIYTIILFFLLIFVSGCVTFHEKFQKADDIENIQNIEVYLLPYDIYTSDIPDGYKPIYTIDNNLYEELIDELEQLDYKQILIIIAANDPNFDLHGFIFKITYKSGTYQLVGNSGACYTYGSDDTFDSFTGMVNDETWKTLVIKYIGQEIFEQYKLPY